MEVNDPSGRFAASAPPLFRGSRVALAAGRAPDIVEAILDGRQPAATMLAALMRPFAVGWWEPAGVFSERL